MPPHTWSHLGDTVSDSTYDMYYRGQKIKEAYYRGEKIWGEEEDDLIIELIFYKGSTLIEYRDVKSTKWPYNDVPELSRTPKRMFGVTVDCDNLSYSINYEKKIHANGNTIIDEISDYLADWKKMHLDIEMNASNLNNYFVNNGVSLRLYGKNVKSFEIITKTYINDPSVYPRRYGTPSIIFNSIFGVECNSMTTLKMGDLTMASTLVATASGLYDSHILYTVEEPIPPQFLSNAPNLIDVGGLFAFASFKLPNSIPRDLFSYSNLITNFSYSYPTLET